MNRRLLLVAIMLAQLSVIFGQNFDPIDIPFEIEGERVQNALIGGLIAPQFSSFDLDGEGAEDLLVFDRSGNVLLPFINMSTPGNPDYVFVPEFVSQFPEMSRFAQFHDYNGDGKKDIFTKSSFVPAIEVWKNTSQGGNISFELVKFNFGIGHVLQIAVGNEFTNLYLSSLDIPAIIDVDGDEDLDILTFDSGGHYMNLYKNMVKEQGLPPDTLVYELSDYCWGKFAETGVGEEVSLSDDPNNCYTGLQDGKDVIGGSRHAGSTVLALDGDGDGDLDMLLGDLSNSGLVYLQNGQNSENAFIVSQNTKYPTVEEEVDVFVFVAPFFIDVDNDGKRDLIAAQNNINGAQNVDHIWYYNNVGTDSAPIFELVQKDFLQSTSLNMGSNSHPTFLDYNADGLLDILVGNNRKVFDASNDEKSLYLYENIGTKSEPEYSLVSEDYLGMKDIVNEFDGYLAPTVGDLDSDGDDDILIGDKRGYLYYWENIAGAGLPYEFEDHIYEFKGIKPGSNVKPEIYDLDNDGLNDLIIGEKNNNVSSDNNQVGGLNFYKNIGSMGAPDFDADQESIGNTNILGNVNTRVEGYVGPSSSPTFFTSDGEVLLSVGSQSGDIFIYNNIEGNLYDSFDILYHKLPILNSGGRINPIYADLDDDNFYEVIVGSENGGLRAFNTIFVVDGELSITDINELKFTISPNPTIDILNVNMENSRAAEYSIIDINGRRVRSGKLEASRTRLDIQDLSPGVYIIDVNDKAKSSVKRFVKL